MEQEEDDVSSSSENEGWSVNSDSSDGDDEDMSDFDGLPEESAEGVELQLTDEFDWYRAWDRDPHVVKVCIELGKSNDTKVAQALETYSLITKLEVDVRGMGDGNNWPRLCRALATGSNLQEVTLSDYRDIAGVSREPADHIRPLIQAIQQNQATRSVFFIFLNLSDDVVISFLDTATSVTSFNLMTAVGESFFERRQNSAQTLASAWQRNLHIIDLSISGSDTAELVEILRGLVTNKTVQRLRIRHHTWTVDTSRAVQHLLESTSSLQTLSLSGDFTEDTFRPIAQGLSNCHTVTEMQFFLCKFSDAGSKRLFSKLVQSKPNLRALSLDKGCVRPLVSERADCAGVLTTALLRPDSSLRSLFFPAGVSEISVAEFREVLRAVEKSKLEDLSIGTFQRDSNLEHFLALKESIPEMKITSIKLYGIPFSSTGHLKRSLLQSFKRNYTLLSAFIGQFDEEENETLQSILERNKHLAQWLDNPSTVPRHLWPEAIKLAGEAGNDCLFRGLQSLAGKEIGSELGRRRRRRPRYYEPP